MARKRVMRAMLLALTVGLVVQGILIVLPEEAEAYQLVIQPSKFDTSIVQVNPNTNFGKASLLSITSGPVSGPVANNRTILKFDISALSEGYWITQAFITLSALVGYESCEDFDLQKNVHAYRVRTYWGESSATWMKEPDYAAEPSGEASSVLGSTFNIYITDLVRDWYDGTYANYGVMLRMAHEGGDGEGDFCTNSFASRDLTFPTGVRPKLTINYEDFEDYVNIEIVEPMMTIDPPQQWDVVISNNCSCPMLKSSVDYHGTLEDVRYEISTTDPGDTWTLTLLAIYEDHTGLWVAELDCGKMKDLGPYYYNVTAKAQVSGIPPKSDSDFIWVKVDNEWLTDRLVWVWYYFGVEGIGDEIGPNHTFAVVEEFDGEHQLLRVDLESPVRREFGTDLQVAAIVVAVPDHWEIYEVTVGTQVVKITNLPNATVVQLAPSSYPYNCPPNTDVYSISSNYDRSPWLFFGVTYKLWFLVDNPWYR